MIASASKLSRLRGEPSNKPSAEDVATYTERLESMIASKLAKGALPEVVELPPLVQIFGTERAKAYVTRIVLANRYVVTAGDRDTLALAKAAVLANSDKLKFAQWGVISSVDDIELMRGMWKRFGAPRAQTAASRSEHDDFDQGSRRSGPEANACYFVFGTLKRDGRDAALAIAKTLPADVWWSWSCLAALGQLEIGQHGGAIYELLTALLDADPSLRLQRALAGLASAAQRGEGFRALAAKLARDPALDPNDRKAWLQALFDSLLADDRIAEAAQLAAEHPGSLRAPDNEHAPTSNIGALFVRIGHLLQDEKLADAGFALDARIPASTTRMTSGPLEDLERCELFLLLGRYGEVERCVGAAISERAKPQADRSYSTHDMRPLLALLVRAYAAAGRFTDVIELLNKAPWWDAERLEEVTDGMTTETVVAIARSLHATGNAAAAIDLLKRNVLLRRSDDDAYALLVEIGDKDELLVWLGAVQQLDRFEERPLIWKAKILLAQGNVDAAEETARRALGVDPSDGEAQPGQRIYGYWVMSEVLRARGNGTDAKFFADVVRAIRISERADDLRDLGLSKRALAVYREAQKSFSDTYCIHWRLAEQMHGLGMFSEAAGHYKLAFQHMPHQFGRVATMCMHCANLFGREHARKIAETVFSEIMASEPQNARAFHLMAELRVEQGREDDAVALLRRAVALDPEYGDAWKDLLRHLLEQPADRVESDRIRLRLFEMDPLQVHFPVSLRDESIRDLSAVWRIAEAHKKLQMAEPLKHVRLDASLARQKSLEQLDPNAHRASNVTHADSTPFALPTPARVLAEQPLLTFVLELLGAHRPTMPT